MPTRHRDPASRDGLIHRLAALRTEGLDFWRHLDGDAFWTAAAPGWSPADNLRHLILSTRPVALALRLPRLLLGALFGTSRAPSGIHVATPSRTRASRSAGSSGSDASRQCSTTVARSSCPRAAPRRSVPSAARPGRSATR